MNQQIQAIYAAAVTRSDVENIELQDMDPGLCTPFLSNGMQVHLPYTVYAHWFLLRRLLQGAGVSQVQASMDIDSMSRAAFLCAYAEEVRRGEAHGFFVRYSKYYTVDQRRRIMEESRRHRARFATPCPRRFAATRRPSPGAMMQAQFDDGTVVRQMEGCLVRPPVAHHERTEQGGLLTHTAGQCAG